MTAPSTEYDLRPRFYHILNIPPCPLSRAEFAHHLHRYLKRTGALVSSDGNRDEYIPITEDIAYLSGMDTGQTYILREGGVERYSYEGFIHLVFRRMVRHPR
jgi:hypothetical protein